MNPPVSVVVLTHNEAENIASCLLTLSWSNDIVVLDDGSSDGTQEIAQKNGARVIQHDFESFARQRNWALTGAQLKNEWVLFLDADEHATPEFVQGLSRTLTNAPVDLVALRICRKTMFLGKWLRRSDSYPVWIMRVVRRDRATFQDSGHGEVPVPAVAGRVGTIREPIIHFPFSKGLDDWFERHNRYSTRECNLEMLENRRTPWSELVSWDTAVRRRALRALARCLPARPLLRFGYQYVWRGGFLEGTAGLTFCSLMAMYEFMIIAKRRDLTFRLAKGASSTSNGAITTTETIPQFDVKAS